MSHCDRFIDEKWDEENEEYPDPKSRKSRETQTTEKKNHGRIQIPEIETETLSFSEFGLIYTNFVGKVHTAGT